MFKTLTLTALLGLAAAALPVSAQSNSDRYEIAPDHVDFGYKPQDSTQAWAPNVAESSAMTLLNAKSKAEKAGKTAAAAPALTNVEDAAARMPAWWHGETIVIAMIALAAIFMRLIMVRQRGPKRSDAIFVETIR